MITTNIDTSNGLTNGVMGCIVNIVRDIELNVKAILVKFENEDVGQVARKNSLYKSINHNAVPIEPFQASFQINGSASCNVFKMPISTKTGMGSHHS